MVEQVIKGQTVIEAWNRGAALWGLTLCITGTILGCVLKILGKEGIHLGGPFTPYMLATAVVMAVGGMGLMAYAFLPAMKVQRLTQPNNSTGKPAHTQPDLLAGSPPTITEHTTELFAEEVTSASPLTPTHSP